MVGIKGKFLDAGSVLGAALSANAMQTVLQSKLKAARDSVLGKSVTGGSANVTTEVEAAATPGASPVSAYPLVAKGIFVGTISGANDTKRVLIRAHGTDNGIADGNGDDVYGVLSFATSVYTLTFKKADGTGHSFATSTSIDFYFVEVFDLYGLPVDAALGDAVGGVIDATAAGALTTHINNATGAHADTAIASTFSGTHYLDAATQVHAALSAIDGQLYTNAQAISTHTGASTGAHADTAISSDFTDDNYLLGSSNIHDQLAALSSAIGLVSSTDFDDSFFRISKHGAPTKKIAFSATAITAGNTRTVSVPDNNVNLGFVRKTVTEVTAALTGTDISNKYVDLVLADSNVYDPANTTILNPVGGVRQVYTEDYTIVANSPGTSIIRINWSGLGMGGMLEAGDRIHITYQLVG